MTSHSDIQLFDEILAALISDEILATKDDFHRLKNTILAKYKKETAPTAIELISRYQELVDA